MRSTPARCYGEAIRRKAAMTTPTKSLVQSQFAANAENYATSAIHAEGMSLKRLVEMTKPQAGWQALDVATGTGHTAMAFAPHVAEVTATDLTPRMMEVAAELTRQRGLTNISFKEASAEALPFADGTFDLVTCRIAPHHFDDVPRFVQEVKRVLKPGGTFGLVDNIAPESPKAAEALNAIEKVRDPSHARCLSAGEWLALLGRSGFAVHHHEILDKDMDLDSWAGRMSVSDDSRPTLVAMLGDPMPELQAYLRTQESGDNLKFNLEEAVFVATKMA
jgi:ubiquinone/menaquinone biosynthesis C-methylase UbiE